MLHVGLLMQVTGFFFAFASDNPILGDRLLNAGFCVAGLGGAGLVYGMQVGAGGSVPYPGGPWSYTPPERRWPTAVFAVAGTPLWGVLSLPLALLLYLLAGIGWAVVGVHRVLRLCRPRIDLGTQRCDW
jgi:hypothetical protein